MADADHRPAPVGFQTHGFAGQHLREGADRPRATTTRLAAPNGARWLIYRPRNRDDRATH